jgi:Tol biopolymer transport system component
MNFATLFKSIAKRAVAFRRGVAILAVSILCIVTATVATVRGAGTTLDVHGLTGKVFLIRYTWSGDDPQTRGRRFILVMNANGSDSRVILNEFDRVSSLEWYPRLNSLGVSTTSTKTLLDRNPPPDAINGMYTVEINGQSAENVSISSVKHSIPDDFPTHFYDPMWENKNGQNTLIPNSKAYMTRATFSPDGKWIAGIASSIISATRGFNLRMCVAGVDSRTQEKCALSIQPHETSSPVWSPDGTKIVFSGCLKENAFPECNLTELFVVNADMKGAFQLTDISGPKIEDKLGIVQPGMKMDVWHKSSNPRWSPDGSWIAFMSYGGIYRVHPDGTGLRLIIPNGSFPVWSPDGTTLMYVLRTGHQFDPSGPSDRIFVAHADGSGQTEVPLDNVGPGRYTYTDLNWAE